MLNRRLTDQYDRWADFSNYRIAVILMSDHCLGLEANFQFCLTSASRLLNLSDCRLGSEINLQFGLISASRLLNLSDRCLGPETNLQF